MLISTSLRWLVVAVSAAMLLAVAAACAGETVEVPGETVVVEKEVIRTVEVPGETVVKEVVKEVQVPGETVVVKEVVTETVEVPGETVVVEKEVVKTVEVPGETVTVEVVKEVMVPGETVVVEKEVVKTVEVPGETVVVEKQVPVEIVKTVEVVKTIEVPGPERVMVKEVPGKTYVTDPTTGNPVTKPEYGGTITFATGPEPSNTDALIAGQWSARFVGGVLEKPALGDWGIDRNEWDFQYLQVPFATRGGIAASWSQPDPLTIILHIREGVNWHNKAPMNGRELTADDVVYDFHRVMGWGGGLTEPSPFAYLLKNVAFESITATDEYTVEFKLKEISLAALAGILDGSVSWIYPPDVIEEDGDATDWRRLVGTGPMMLTDWTEGSSITWEKSPDYWGYDEKYPDNRLPYIDKLRALVIPEVATRVAALRSAKVDYLDALRSIDTVANLRETNPELVIWPYYNRSENSFGLNVNNPPFDDLRVRQAMQMALDLETMNDGYFKGYGETTPQGHISRSIKSAAPQFEDWPEEVKINFTYNKEGARQLLADAGYPDGFETTLVHNSERDLNWVELAATYWSAIGVDVDIKPAPRAQFAALRRDHDFEMISNELAFLTNPFLIMSARYQSTSPGNTAAVADPVYDAMIEVAKVATTIEEQDRLAGEMDMYAISRFWAIWGPVSPQFRVTQPWIKGYNGEGGLGSGRQNLIFTRIWIDQELKEAMGH